jgi:16S rRNA (adenine1518-N6/adenine1519-N6)-dimethyltransferase
VITGDALEVDLSQWGTATIAGNLPYYVATPLLARVLGLRANLRRAVFLIQKEVAQRITAEPGAADYGYLSVQTKLFADSSLLFTVQPSAFRPPPKVDSAVVELRPNDRIAEFKIDDPAKFLEFAGQCFRQKRKTIRNNLAGIYGKQTIDAWPEAGMRAEQLSIDQFAAMYRRIRSIHE